jgi:hypothetical protein
MNDSRSADQSRKQVLSVQCGECGQAAGFLCVSAGGHELSIGNQHAIRYSQAGVRRAELRALLVKARLV